MVLGDMIERKGGRQQWSAGRVVRGSVRVLFGSVIKGQSGGKSSKERSRGRRSQMTRGNQGAKLITEGIRKCGEQDLEEEVEERMGN